MTRGDVIKLARQAGIGGMLTDLVCTMDELERFAGLVVAAERAAQQAACATSPAWGDAPTVPGVWICDEVSELKYEWRVQRVKWPLHSLLLGGGERWYGPIPEDGK